MSFLLAEQTVGFVLRYVDYACVVENGEISAHGPTAELASRTDLAALYHRGAVPVD